jgi:hypothetical protein
VKTTPPAPLKSAFEIAIGRYDRHQDLSGVMAEIEEHVLLLEECWDAIGSRAGNESTSGIQPESLAA